VFDDADITKLTKEAYEFVILYHGFIAHYDHAGFKSYYENHLPSFCSTISEHLGADYNETWFRSKYGEEYCDSVIGTMRIIKNLAQTNYHKMCTVKFTHDKAIARKTIDALKSQYGL
jgi:hypothetical protein